MSQLGTVYATKRRKRNGKSLKPQPKDGVTKSNPSKRHRERLNAELDLLASLLPFEQNILSKLDRLSILRLAVSYLRTKSYFQVIVQKDKHENGIVPHMHSNDVYRNREFGSFELSKLDGDMFLQALNGFLMILTCEGEVFFTTHSIESYLGFHQSDIVHQSVYELVHSEDREELQRQLMWNSFLPPESAGMQLSDALSPDKVTYLERSFTVRFRCLLDNTSGFLRLDIRGRVKVLHGQNRKTEEPPLGLFAYCTPFGPPSLMEIPQKDNMFKSKHKLDLSLVSMDQWGKVVLGYSDGELASMGGYDLVHYDDLAYVASAHQELLKTGASGMIAYRFQKKNGDWQWLQTSSRLVYKNSKPDFVICTHRQLMEEEGRDLLGKRTMDFKVSYLDTGLASTYFTEADKLVVPPSCSPSILPVPVTPTRTTRKYKTQFKKKRKQKSQSGQVTPPNPVVEYIPDPAVAVAAAYTNLNPMYSPSPYAPAGENLYMSSSVHSTNFYPVSENLFHQYRLQGVSGYYPEYHHSPAPAPYVTNGFLSYDNYGVAQTKEEKWQDTGKYYPSNDISNRNLYPSGYPSPTATQIIQTSLKTPKDSPPPIADVVTCSSGRPSPVTSIPPNHLIPTTKTPNNNSVNITTSGSIVQNTNPPSIINTNNGVRVAKNSSPISSNANPSNNSNNISSNNNNNNNGNPLNIIGSNNSRVMTDVSPKVESPPHQNQHQEQQQRHYEHQRQTVLMWGTTAPNSVNNTIDTSSTSIDCTRTSPPTANLMYSPATSTDAHHLKDASHHHQQSQQYDYHPYHTHHRYPHHGYQYDHNNTNYHHLKWNGNSEEIIYPQRHDGTVDPTAAYYSQVQHPPQTMSHHPGNTYDTQQPSSHHDGHPSSHDPTTDNPQTAIGDVWSPIPLYHLSPCSPARKPFIIDGRCHLVGHLASV